MKCDFNKVAKHIFRTLLRTSLEGYDCIKYLWRSFFVKIVNVEKPVGNEPLNQAEAYLVPRRTSKMKLFAKIVNILKLVTIFAKKLHRKCSTGF